MKSHKTRTVPYRRKREGKTDYKKRLKILLSAKPRLVIRKSLTCINAQIVEYDEKGDRIIATANSKELKKFGWNFNYRNIPSAYLLGLLIAERAKEKKVMGAILDIGMQKSVPGSRLYAVLRGACDNGLDVPHSEDVLPNADRINGKHVQEYAIKLKENNEEYNKKFGAYLKSNADPCQMTKIFQDTKNKIVGA